MELISSQPEHYPTRENKETSTSYMIYIRIQMEIHQSYSLLYNAIKAITTRKKIGLKMYILKAIRADKLINVATMANHYNIQTSHRSLELKIQGKIKSIRSEVLWSPAQKKFGRIERIKINSPAHQCSSNSVYNLFPCYHT